MNIDWTIVGVALVTGGVGLASGLVTERIRRSAHHAQRLLESRIDIYGELLKHVSQLVDNGTAWAHDPHAVLDQPSDEALNWIYARTRIVASEDAIARLETFRDAAIALGLQLGDVQSATAPTPRQLAALHAAEREHHRAGIALREQLRQDVIAP